MRLMGAEATGPDREATARALKEELRAASASFRKGKSRHFLRTRGAIYCAFSTPALTVRREEAQRDAAQRLRRFGITEGLGIVPGTVKQLPDTAPDGSRLKRPHVGWSELRRSSQSWDGSPLERIAEGTAAYFVHSFHLVPDDPRHLLADASYVGTPVHAAVRSGRVFGVQFHPEKSGQTGLGILDGFLRLVQTA